MRPLSVLVVPLVAALVAVGCSKSTGPTFPALAGTYAGTTQVVITDSSGMHPSPGPTLTITLGAPDASGTFTGTYTVTGGSFSSGAVAGVIASDGSVTLTRFGDPSTVPFLAMATSIIIGGGCDFADAAVTGGLGNLAGRTLTLAGGFGTTVCTFVDSVHHRVLMHNITMQITVTAAHS